MYINSHTQLNTSNGREKRERIAAICLQKRAFSPISAHIYTRRSTWRILKRGESSRTTTTIVKSQVDGGGRGRRPCIDTTHCQVIGFSFRSAFRNSQLGREEDGLSLSSRYAEFFLRGEKMEHLRLNPHGFQDGFGQKRIVGDPLPVAVTLFE